MLRAAKRLGRESRARAGSQRVRHPSKGSPAVITSIEMKKFRGIVQGKLEDLTPLVILVGPNASGKSTVLDALLIGASPSVGEGIAQAVLRHRGVKIGAPWLLWKTDTHAKTEISVATPTGHRACRIQVPEQDRVRCAVIRHEGIVTQDKSTDVTEVVFATEAQYRVDRDTQPLPEVEAVHILGSPEEAISTPLHKLLTDCFKRGKKQEVGGYLRELAPSIRDVVILTEGDGLPIVHIEYSDRSVPVALGGDGYHALVRALLEMVSCSDGLVLYEEPELHQHPGAIRQTVRAILAAVRRNVQVVLTTHSLELIDLLLSESTGKDIETLTMYRLRLEDGNLISHRIPGKEVAFSRTEVEKDLR